MLTVAMLGVMYCRLPSSLAFHNEERREKREAHLDGKEGEDQAATVAFAVSRAWKRPNAYARLLAEC